MSIHHPARRSALGFAALLMLATALTPAQAETIESEDQATDPGSEIIVTAARRRAESVQDVPVAVAVVSGETLDATGAFNIARLTQLQPSVQFLSSNPRNTAINIRGIGAPFGLTNDGIEQGVGLYIDQVYYARIAASTMDFVDIDSLEILRGPQGTLYGKNTTSGAINISTRRPGFEFESRGELTIGNLDFFQAKASVSGPLVADTLSARLSASLTRRRGMLFNTVTNRHVNDTDNIGLRGQIFWQASDRLEVILYGDYSRQDPEAFAQNYVKAVPTLRAANRQFAALAAASSYAPASTNPFDRLVDADTPLTARNVNAGLSLNATLDLGPATLTSITAWRSWDWGPSNDRDFTGLPITTVSANPSQQQQWSQELRLASDGKGRLDYVVGLFGFHQRINTQGVQEQGALAGLWLLGPAANAANPGLINGLRSDNDIRYRNTSAALYGKLTWKITESLSFAPGLRLNYDKKDGIYDARVSGGLPAQTQAQQNLKNGVLASQTYETEFRDWNLSGDATLSWKATADLLLYATYARAFKSGGINLSGVPNRADGVTPAVELAAVRPEQTNHYELGYKSEWLDRKATLNLSAFRTDITDYQATVVDNSVGVLRGYLSNVPKVRSQGLEAELAVRPSRNLSAYLNYAYTDATYVRFPGAPVPVELSGGNIQFVDASGGRMPGVSAHAFSYGFEARLPDGPREFYLGLDGTTRSSFSSSPTPSAVMNVNGYTLTNLRAGIRLDEGRWDAFLWVRNAFDTKYFDFLTAAPGSTGLIVGQPGDPRTWGLTLAKRF